MMKLSRVLPRLTYAIPVFVVVAVLACSGELTVEVEKEVAREVEATPTVEVVATATPAPTPEPVETATPAPDEEEEVEKTPIEVPDRGYNTVGSPDAPVTLFDFSDFT